MRGPPSAWPSGGWGMNEDRGGAELRSIVAAQAHGWRQTLGVGSGGAHTEGGGRRERCDCHMGPHLLVHLIVLFGAHVMEIWTYMKQISKFMDRDENSGQVQGPRRAF